MEADSFKIAKVFSNGGDIHFRLPYFQREYAWTKTNWETLWNDIIDLYSIYDDEKPPEHFMGSLVVINEGTVHGTIPVFKLVDGQQRLISISLIICGLGNLIKNTDQQLFNKIQKYITNPDEQGDLFFKIFPTSKYHDRETYLSTIRGSTNTSDDVNGSQILPAYKYFYSAINQKLLNKEMDAERLFLVLINSLQVVFINLNNNERPYQIFESLNAKGKPLSQADLVRNYIAMKLPENRQPYVFDSHWSEIEELLQEKRLVGKSGLGELTAFLRHYLGFRSGVLCNEQHVYARFRDRIENEFSTPALFEEEIITLKHFAVFYDHFLRPEKEINLSLRSCLINLNLLEMMTGYPLLLAMFDAKSKGQINENNLIEGLKILENYMVRRYLAGEPSNYLNKAFPTVWKDIDTSDFTSTLKLALLEKKYPGDYRIKQSVHNRRLYDKSTPTRAKTTFLFEAINMYISKKKNMGAFTMLDDTPTIEHIMPQTLNSQWKSELGKNFEQVYDQYLDTLGNLTIVTSEWNARLSNSAFSEKRSILSNHGLILNSEYFGNGISQWNESEIIKRSDFLASLILEIWPALGELPTPKTSTGKKPVKLSFLSQDFPVKSWRDVAVNTAESLIKIVDNFENIAISMPEYFSKDKFRSACHLLSNNWYMQLNLSANSIKRLCKNLIKKAGLSESDWSVEEIDY